MTDEQDPQAPRPPADPREQEEARARAARAIVESALDSIITMLIAGMSIGQITKEAGVNMGEVRSHFGEFRSELARSETNPPTKDCLNSTP